MGKRSNFERKPRDFYPTPAAAVLPLLDHLPARTRFAEPCAGDGALVDHLEAAGHVCYWKSDIEPHGYGINRADALTLTSPLKQADYIITNPPWDVSILHPMIEHFSLQAPTWLLFYADWMHTRQAEPFLRYCRFIVSVGRVSWEGNGVSGKDNVCWYMFDQSEGCSPVTEFFGR